jgi:hypothetical protein
MSDDFQSDYLSRRGMDRDALANRQMIERANRRMEVVRTAQGMPADMDFWFGAEPLVKGAAELAVDTAANTAENAAQGTQAALQATDGFLRDNPVTATAYSAYADTAKGMIEQYLPDMSNAVNEFGRTLQSDDTQNDRMAQTFFQYTVPFMGWLKGANALAGGAQAMTATQQGAAAVGADVMTSWTNIQPHFDRMSSFLNEFETTRKIPVINHVIDYIASEDGSDAENRLKNVMDSLVAGGLVATAATGFVGALKISKGLWREASNGTLLNNMGRMGTPGQQAGAINPRQVMSDKLLDGTPMKGTKLTKTETEFLQGFAPGDFKEMREFAPSVRFERGEIWAEPKDLEKLAEYFEDVHRLSDDPGSIPPRFRNGQLIADLSVTEARHGEPVKKARTKKVKK